MLNKKHTKNNPISFRIKIIIHELTNLCEIIDNETSNHTNNMTNISAYTKYIPRLTRKNQEKKIKKHNTIIETFNDTSINIEPTALNQTNNRKGRISQCPVQNIDNTNFNKETIKKFSVKLSQLNETLNLKKNESISEKKLKLISSQKIANFSSNKEKEFEFVGNQDEQINELDVNNHFLTKEEIDEQNQNDINQIKEQNSQINSDSKCNSNFNSNTNIIEDVSKNSQQKYREIEKMEDNANRNNYNINSKIYKTISVNIEEDAISDNLNIIESKKLTNSQIPRVSNINNQDLNKVDSESIIKGKYKSKIDKAKSESVNKRMKAQKVNRKSTVNMVATLDIHLEDRKKQNQLLFELSNYPNCLIMIDKNLDIIYCNKHIGLTLLYAKNDLLDQKISSILGPKDLDNKIKIITNLFIDNVNVDDTKMLNDPESFKISFIDITQREIQFYVTPNFFNQVNAEDEKCSNLILQMDPIGFKVIWCIVPNNIVQICFSLLIFIILIQLLVQVPQDIAFGDDKLNQFNFLSDMVTTFIFSVDIMLNFFVSQEKEDGVWEQDVYKIAINQLSNGFLMDVVATVPFDYIVEEIAVNTSIIKSIKIIKIFKMVKILRITKLFSLKNNSIKNTLGTDLILILKKSSGFFDLMRQNLYILICSHYQTIFYQFLKISVLPETNENWLQDYFQIYSEEPFQIQLELVSENVKTALGMGTQRLQNLYEIMLQMGWMFFGLSLFGYGIGNISSYLSNSNQSEVRYEETKSFFMEICENYNVDPRVYQLIKNDIDNQYRNSENTEIIENAKALTRPVFLQLETYVYKELVSSFNMFSKLNSQIIRLLSLNLIKESTRLQLTRGSNIKDIYLITRGKLSLQDGRRKLVNYQCENEMFGFSKFLEFFQSKQSTDLDSLIESFEIEEKKDNDSKEQLMMMLNCKDFLIETMEGKCKHMDVYFKRENYFKDEEELVKVINDYLPVTSEDCIYQCISFETLESIVLDDFESFLVIWRYQRKQLEKISEEKKNDCDIALNEFKLSDTPGIIVLEDAEIQEVNDAFTREQHWAADIVGNDFVHLMSGNIYKMNDLEVKTYQIFYNQVRYDLRIEAILNKSIRYGINLNNSVLDQSEEMSNYQLYNLNKCLRQAQFVQFSINASI